MSDIVGDPSSNSENVANPDAVKTPDGALAFYRGVVQLQAYAISDFTAATGLLTDELSSFSNQQTPLDYRILPTTSPNGTFAYARLQAVRAGARQGRGILPKYALTLPAAYVGHLYAIEAMADVMLAELFCSGVPLSTVDFGGDFTPRAGSSTKAVYQEAITLFDAAIAGSADSVRIQHFAQIGKGRALLALGEFAAAATAVADVPTDYAYNVEYRYLPAINLQGNGFWRASANAGYAFFVAPVTVSDREGETGVPYVSSGDPRSAMTPGVDQSLDVRLPVYVAQKYDMTGETPIVIASGIEARLIEAEAALRANDVPTWAGILNDLRASAGAFLNPTVPPVAALGTDSTTALSPDERVNLLFQERAYWLFLTGHRQGDLRRLVRSVSAGGFGRPQETVYPSGLYFGGNRNGEQPPSVYGVDVTEPVPTGEQERNPLYTGCINRQA